MTPKTKKRIRILLIAGVAGFVLLQVFPAKVIGIPTQDIGTNPPERYTLNAPPEVLAVMKRACWDCHTHETKWPLYARIAPGSWLMARDVHNGRNHLNFSKWADVDEDERKDDLQTCWEQVESGAMPKWFYVFPFHPSAKLSDADKALLKSYFLKDKVADAAKGDVAKAGGEAGAGKPAPDEPADKK
ncbi:MAG TPA: heme-binding domain-containing protein [Polyangia bacterium]